MPVETLLGTVKEFVIRFSDIISNTIDADVIIADNNFKIVGNTSRYYTVYDEVDADSLIAEVVKSRKKLIVEDKAGRASCLKCLHFDECKLFGFVGVPIFHNDIIAGAIALILPQHRVNSLFENIDSSVEFLENMAELLSGKIDAINENKSLNQIIIEQEAMMDLLSDAVVFTDFFGNIRHYNKLFQNLFLVTQDCIGKQLQEFIPHAIFEESYENQKEFKNIRIHFAWGNVEFYGFISSKYVRINGKDYGTMFSFRTVNEVLRNAQLSEKGSLVTFNWSEWMFPREILKQAKSLAITHNNILILGRNRNLNEILAKGITNYSERSLKGLKLLYCDNLYRDLLEVFLFDEFGELRDSNMGTMLVQDVENLPLHIQKRFLHFLKTGKIGLNNDTSAESDVRFIFATTKNLKDYVDKGLFMEELYYRIAEYSIEVSGIQ
ncbi:sigma 54-interacting transcriptional regulator, partial [Lachnotalea glycerini]